jgi:uncharacterized membrane protein YoaK (UPF0700 family)
VSRPFSPRLPGQRRFLPDDVEDARVVLLVVLTFVTGSVDAVSYLGLQRVFTANMTGNVALIGFAAGGAHGLPLVRSGLALLAFVAGAAAGGRLVRSADLRAPWPARVTVALLASVGLLVIVFATWVGRHHAPQAELAASAMAFAMGIQGAATRKLGVADLPTTVVTSTLTGLAADSFLGGGTGVRWRRRATSVAALVLGAFSGGALVQVSPSLGLLPGIGVLAAVCAVATVHDLHAPVTAADVMEQPAAAK